MTNMVRNPLSNTGPKGVPKGLVEEKKLGNGSKPCLAISRIIRAWPTVYSNALFMKHYAEMSRNRTHHSNLGHKSTSCCGKSWLGLQYFRSNCKPREAGKTWPQTMSQILAGKKVLLQAAQSFGLLLEE